MTTLRNKLKSSSGLAETSLEEMSAQTGRSSQPISPMGASGIGGNADQAKMAGTGQQKTGALRTAIQGEQDLATAQRREQTRSTASQSEQEKLASAAKLQGLSGMEDRVEELAQQQLAEGLSAGAGQTAELTVAEGVDTEEAILMQNIINNPNDLDSLVKLNNLRGITNPDEMLDANQLFELINQQGNIGTILSSSVGDNIASGALNLTEMGFEGPEELEQLLGLGAGELANMNVQDLLSNIDQVLETEYNKVESLQQQANDPFLGAAERANARKTLKEMGAVGVRSAESDIDQLAEEIADDSMISFGGEEIGIEELLSDEYLEGVVANYFDNPEYAKKLKESEPDLVSFLEQHRETLEQASESVSNAQKELVEINEYNKNLGQIEGLSISDEAMESILPGFNQLSATKMDVSQVPLLNTLHNTVMPAESKQNIVQNINNLTSIDPSLGEELKGLGQSELTLLELTNPNSDKVKSISDYYETNKNVEALIEQKGTLEPSDILMFIFPEDQAGGEQILKDAAKAQAAGLSGGIDIPISLLPNGEIDYAQLNNYITSAFGDKKGISEFTTNSVPMGFSSINTSANKAKGSEEYKLYESVQDFINPEYGYIEPSQIDNLVATTSPDNIYAIIANSESNPEILTDAGKQSLINKSIDNLSGEFNQLYQDMGMENFDFGTLVNDLSIGPSEFVGDHAQERELQKVGEDALAQLNKLADQSPSGKKQVYKAMAAKLYGQLNPYRQQRKRNVQLGSEYTHPTLETTLRDTREEGVAGASTNIYNPNITTI